MNKPNNRKQLLLKKVSDRIDEKSIIEELEQELFQTEQILGQSNPSETNPKKLPGPGTLLNNLPGMAYRCINDEGWTMLFVNSVCFDLTGYSPEELINNAKISFSELIHPDDREMVNNKVQIKTKFRQPFKVEYRLFDKRNNLRWVFEQGQVAGQLADGRIFLEGFIMDITESVQAEKALKASEETYHNLFHNAQVGLFRSGIEDGKILESNEQFAKMFGYDNREEFINYFVASAYYVPQSRRDEMLKEIRKKGEIRNFKTKFKRKDGTEFVALYSARLYSEKGWLEGVMEDITEQEKAKEQLLESEKALKKAQSIGKIGSWKFDLNNKTVEASEESYRIYGLPINKKLTLDDIRKIPLEEYRKMLDDALLNLIKGKRDYNVTFKIKRPSDGKVFDIHSIAEYNSKKNAVTGIIQDITKRKKAEQLLNESEAMFRSLFDKSNDAIYLMANRKFELVNPAFTDILGYEMEELSRKNLGPIDLIAPESMPIIEERINKLEKGEDVDTRYEFTALTKYGEKREVEASVSYIPYKGSTATQGIIRDVTERKKAEDEIKLLSEFRNLLVELSANFIHVPVEEINESINKSLARMGHFVNAGRTYIFEYNFDQSVCSNTFEWCRDGVKPQIDALQQLPLDFAPDWVEKHRNAQIVHIPNVAEVEEESLRNLLEMQDIKSLLSIPLFNQEKCIGFVGFDSVGKLFNFSSKEIEVLEIYAKILVNSFERQHREKELIEAKEKAEESDLLKSAFLANMSHEIRTPMNGIMGFTNLLKEPKLSGEEKEEYVDIIQQSGERMLNTIDDIISISKLESGTLEVKWEPYKINKQLNYFYKFFKPEAGRKGLDLKLTKSATEEDIVIQADKEKLNAVISNLIKNAIKYTHTGSIEISYHLKTDEVEFIVSDTGIGIDKNRQNAIFERFIQEDFSSTKPYEGAGLGLAISKGYVEMMGGKIGVESEKGKGSKFYFTVPV